MNSAIVTGGAGFIGSHLVDFLLNEGFEVIAIDNLSVGRKANLNSAQTNSKFTFIEADVTDQKIVEIAKNHKADLFFHLAALADIVPSIQKPIDYCNSNISGTINCLELARKLEVKKFVYAASSSCYGIPNKFPTNEKEDIKPMYPYALSKYLGEEAVIHWGQVYSLPVISLRFFNVYGPRARTSGTYGAVFGVFLSQKINHKPFTVVGDGEQTRDFTFVSDIVDGLYKAAESPIVNEIFNLGSGGTYSINTLVKLLDGPIEYIPKRPGEPDCTFADISKVKECLKWEPKVSFEKGVKTMLDHISDWKEAPVWTKDKISEATEDWHKFLK